MSFLLDTHVILWWLTDDPKLTETARGVIADPANELLVSAASAWEVATKYRLGKLPEAEEIAADFAGIVTRSGMKGLPITLAHAMRAGALAGHHRDPFDRMLIAQGQLESIRVVTGDPVFSLYEIDLVW